MKNQSALIDDSYKKETLDLTKGDLNNTANKLFHNKNVSHTFGLISTTANNIKFTNQSKNYEEQVKDVIMILNLVSI